MEKIEKLVFNTKDFKFRTAYQEYIKAFEETESEEERNELNDMIKKVHKEEISYPDFYQAIRDTENWYQYHRTSINTTRKKSYHKNQQKKARNERHR
jgi:hypothetical protein